MLLVARTQDVLLESSDSSREPGAWTCQQEAATPCNATCSHANRAAAHLQAQVGEDEGLGQERRELEEAPQRDLRVGRHAVVAVVRVKDPREEQRHYARQLQHLRTRVQRGGHNLNFELGLNCRQAGTNSPTAAPIPQKA